MQLDFNKYGICNTEGNGSQLWCTYRSSNKTATAERNLHQYGSFNPSSAQFQQIGKILKLSSLLFSFVMSWWTACTPRMGVVTFPSSPRTGTGYYPTFLHLCREETSPETLSCITQFSTLNWRSKPSLERREGKHFMQESIADLASLISCVTHEVGCRNPAIPTRLETAVFLWYFLQCSTLPVCILWN